jgi:hypothetical protein
MASKEEWINRVKEGLHARHVEKLRVTEVVDVIREGLTAFNECI